MDYPAYQVGRYGSLPPSTKVLHGQGGDILLLHDSMIGIIGLTIFGILNGRGEN